MRLIDADKLIEAIKNYDWNYERHPSLEHTIDDVIEIVQEQSVAYNVELPCKTGDDVYFIPSEINYKLNVLSRYRENNRVYHQKVSRITFTERGWYLECDKDLEYGTDHILVDIAYKETWFLSEEEAKQALAEMESEVKP